MTIGDPAGYALAFEEGKATIASQDASLHEVRDRISTVVSASAVAVGLASTLAFAGHRADRFTAWGVVAGVVAAFAFLSIVVAALLVWRPSKWVGVLDSGVIIGSYVEGEPPAELSEIHRELALHLANHALYNRNELSNRLTFFSVALLAFAVEVVALMLMLLDIAQ